MNQMRDLPLLHQQEPPEKLCFKEHFHHTIVNNDLTTAQAQASEIVQEH